MATTVTPVESTTAMVPTSAGQEVVFHAPNAPAPESVPTSLPAPVPAPVPEVKDEQQPAKRFKANVPLVVYPSDITLGGFGIEEVKADPEKGVRETYSIGTGEDKFVFPEVDNVLVRRFRDALTIGEKLNAAVWCSKEVEFAYGMFNASVASGVATAFFDQNPLSQYVAVWSGGSGGDKVSLYENHNIGLVIDDEKNNTYEIFPNPSGIVPHIRHISVKYGIQVDKNAPCSPGMSIWAQSVGAKQSNAALVVNASDPKKAPLPISENISRAQVIRDKMEQKFQELGVNSLDVPFLAVFTGPLRDSIFHGDDDMQSNQQNTELSALLLTHYQYFGTQKRVFSARHLLTKKPENGYFIKQQEEADFELIAATQLIRQAADAKLIPNSQILGCCGVGGSSTQLTFLTTENPGSDSKSSDFIVKNLSAGMKRNEETVTKSIIKFLDEELTKSEKFSTLQANVEKSGKVGVIATKSGFALIPDKYRDVVMTFHQKCHQLGDQLNITRLAEETSKRDQEMVQKERDEKDQPPQEPPKEDAPPAQP